VAASQTCSQDTFVWQHRPDIDGHQEFSNKGMSLRNRKKKGKDPETHDGIADVLAAYEREGRPWREIGSRRDRCPALHFEWCLPSLRRHERYAHFPLRNIVLPSMRLVVHNILTGSSLAMAVLTGATGWKRYGIQHRGFQRLMAACSRRALSPYGTLVRSLAC
jgi:hypothetical protein